MTKIDQNMPKSDFTVLFEAIFSEKTHSIICPSVTRSLQKKNKADFEKKRANYALNFKYFFEKKTFGSKLQL